MTYAVIAGLFSLILAVSASIGARVAKWFGLKSDRFYGILGFSVIQAVLFVVYIPLSALKCNGVLVNGVFLGVMVLLAVLFYEKNKIRMEIRELVLWGFYLVLMVLLSSMVTLGEQQGDSTWYFSMVVRNIDAEQINAFNAYNGLTGSTQSVGVLYLYQSFYQFFSALLLPVKTLFPSLHLYAVCMWVSNLLFYTFSLEIIFNGYRKFRNKIGLYASLLFAGVFTGNYIYNLSLPHIGVIFLGVLLSDQMLKLYDQISEDSFSPVLLCIYTLACQGLASSGFFLQFFIVFAVIVYALIAGRDIVAKIWILAAPTALYGCLLLGNPIFTVAVIALEIILFVFGRWIERCFSKELLTWIGKALPFFVFAVFGLVSIFIAKPAILDFFKDESSYVLIQNYFNFTSLEGILFSIFHYLLLGYLIWKKKNGLGLIVVILVVCFINPLVYPAVSSYLTSVTVYHRVFYLLFCNGLLVLGINMLCSEMKKIHLQYVILAVCLLFGIKGVLQERSYVYHPDEENYSSLLKMNQDGVSAVEYISGVIDIEGLVNPQIVTQFYGTNIIEPELYNLTGADVYKGFVKYKENDPRYQLYRIFYNPIFYSDESVRMESDYHNACKYLNEQQVVFVLIDKSFSVINEYGDWVPLEWMVRNCAQKSYENNSYVVYRFYW